MEKISLGTFQPQRGEDFMACCKRLMAERSCSFKQAASAVAARWPEMYRLHKELEDQTQHAGPRR